MQALSYLVGVWRPEEHGHAAAEGGTGLPQRQATAGESGDSVFLWWLCILIDMLSAACGVRLG